MHSFLVSSLDDVVGESVEDRRRVGVQLLPDLIRDEHPIAVLDLVHDLLQLFDLAPSLLAILLRTQRESLLLLLPEKWFRDKGLNKHLLKVVQVRTQFRKYKRTSFTQTYNVNDFFFINSKCVVQNFSI